MQKYECRKKEVGVGCRARRGLERLLYGALDGYMGVDTNIQMSAE